MPYRTPRSLSAWEAAYLAGLIDGEGTVALTRRHRSDNRQLVVSISSTESAILDYVLHIVGAGRITRKRTYRFNHAQSFTYAIANRQALELLRQIYPYLKSYKVARTALVLEHYVRLTPRNGKYTQQIIEERERFIHAFLRLSTGRRAPPTTA